MTEKIKKGNGLQKVGSSDKPDLTIPESSDRAWQHISLLHMSIVFVVFIGFLFWFGCYAAEAFFGLLLPDQRFIFLFTSLIIILFGCFLWWMSRYQQRLIKDLHLQSHNVSVLEMYCEFAQQWKTRYDAATLASELVLYDINATTNHVTYGQNLTHILGYTIQEMEGGLKCFYNLVFEDDLPILQEKIDRILLSKKQIYMVFRIRKKDGAYIPVEFQGAFHSETNHPAHHVIGFFKDITEEKRASEMLRNIDERFRAITDSYSEAVVTFDSLGRIIYINQGGIKMLGYDSEEQLLGKTVTVLMPEKSHTPQHPLLQRFSETGEPALMGKTTEILALKNDGSEIPVEVSLSSWEADEEKLFTTIIRDISERIRLETALQQSKENLSRAMSIAHLGNWIWNMVDGNVFWSDEIYKIFNLTPGQITPSNDIFINYAHPDDRERVKKIVDLYISEPDTPCVIEFRIVFDDGQEKNILEHREVERNKEGKPVRMVGIVQDITKRKQTEIEIRKIKDDVLLANKAKAEFLANISHEIKTPMNTIMGMVHLAQQTESPVKQKDYLKNIQISAENLLNIINDILDFSKIEAGKLQLKSVPFQLDDVLKKLIDLLALKADEKGIEFLISWDIDTPRTLLGDPLRLNQILLNLIGNAIKFTENGEIIIRIEKISEQASKTVLQFSIKDTGIGMSEEQISRLFKPFTQADTSMTRKFGGTGLGLSISKQIVELMGGQISVVSQFGKGSIFRFTTEFGVIKNEKEDKLNLPPELSDLKILVVDGHVGHGDCLKEMLGIFTQTVTWVMSSEEAVSELNNAVVSKQQSYDLVFIDRDIPEIDDIKTAVHIINDQKLPDTRVILMLTAKELDMNQKQIKLSGQNSILRKPTTPAMLYDAILKVFKIEEEKEEKNDQVLQLSQGKQLVFSGSRLLVVEDYMPIQRVVKEALKSMDIKSDTVNNGLEAVKMIAENKEKFDGVLMDIQLSEMDALESCRQIRTMYEKESLPIIALIANTMKGEKEKCLQAGINDYLSKPINIKELRQVLLKWIKPRFTENIPLENAYRPVYQSDDNGLFRNLPGIDAESSLDRLGGNQSLLKKLILNFREKYAASLTDLQTLLDNDDIESALDLVHAIKGIAGNLSFTGLFSAANKLEKSLAKNGKKVSKNKITTFERAIKEVFMSAEVLNIRCKDQQSSKPSISETDFVLSVSDITPAVQELAESLAKNNLKAQEYLDQLEQTFIDSPYEPVLKSISDLVDNLDFSTALSEVKQLAEKLDIHLRDR